HDLDLGSSREAVPLEGRVPFRVGAFFEVSPVRSTWETASEPPGQAAVPIDVELDLARVAQHPGAAPVAKAAPVPTRATAAFVERRLLDEDREHQLLNLDRNVRRVALVEADGRAGPVLVRAPTVATRDGVEDHKATSGAIEAVDQAHRDIPEVSGRNPVGQRRGERSEDHVDAGAGGAGPPSTRGGRMGADDGSLASFHGERAELAFVDGLGRGGQALERGTRNGD